MRYTATLTHADGRREQKIFDVEDKPRKLNESKHPEKTALQRMIDSQFGTKFGIGSKVIVTCNGDVKFHLELP